MDLKTFLKNIKLNENNISMILGALVIVIAGILVINYIGKQKEASILPGGTTSSQNLNSAVSKTYKVEKGDNLWKIAQKNYGSGYNWVDIAKANNLKNPSLIWAGQELTLPDVPARKPTETISKTPTNISAITGATYTVARGDNLWKIAVRAYGDGYQWVKIARENKLVHPSLIHSGNVLTIPR